MSRKYAPRVTSHDTTKVPPGHGSDDAAEDFSPILPGPGASDYERYLRTDELLSLQKTPEEAAHHDELLFQTVHQSSELWLKHATFEVATATEHLRKEELPAALRLLRRANEGMKIVISPDGHARAPVAVGVHALDPSRPRTWERLRLARVQRGAQGVAGARLRFSRAAARRRCLA